MSSQTKCSRLLPHKVKNNVNRTDLDAIINNGRSSSYSDAVIEYARTKSPEMLKELFPGKGTDDGGRRKLRKSFGTKGRKRTGVTQTSGVNLNKFVKPDGNVDNDAIERAYPGNLNKQVEVLEKLIQHNKPKT